MIKVSVILPTYNVEQYIIQSIHCLIAQTLSEIEVICVDDESTDQTYAILENLARKDSRIKVFKQKHQNAGAARNLGFLHAQGKYVMFLDPDDFFDLTMLEKLYNRIEHDQSDVVICGLYYLLANNQLQYVPPYYPSYVNTDLKIFSVQDVKDEIWKFHVYPVNKMYRTDFLRNKKITFQEILNTNDASFAYEVLINAAKISLLDEGYYYYRYYRPNNTRSSKGKHLDCVIAAYEHSYLKCSKCPQFSMAKDGFFSIILQLYLFHLTKYCNLNTPEYVFFYNHIKSYIKTFTSQHPDVLRLVKEDDYAAYGEIQRIIKTKYEDFFKNHQNSVLKKEFLRDSFKLKIFGISVFKEKKQEYGFKITLLGLLYKRTPSVFIKRYLDNIIRSFQDNYGDTIYLFWEHLGETYLCSYILAAIDKRTPKIVFQAKNQLDCFSMCYNRPFEARIFPTTKKEYMLISQFLLKEKFYLKHYFIQFLPHKFWHSKSITKKPFFQAILKFLHLKVVPFWMPKYSLQAKQQAFEKIKHLGINLKCFILVCPESNSIPGLAKNDWRDICHLIHEQGYEILVNSVFPSQIDIPWAKSTNLTLEEVFALAIHAKAIIGVRSGLIDLLSQIAVPKYIIYSSKERLIRNSLFYLPNTNSSFYKEYVIEQMTDLEQLKNDLKEELAK